MDPIIIAVIAAIAGCLLGGLVGYAYRKSFTERRSNERKTTPSACMTTPSAKPKTTRKKKCWKPRKKS